MPENKAESGFKFVDRRRIDETGESRIVEDVKAPTSDLGDKDSVDEDPASGPITFSLFLQSLAQQALMSMGVIAWPDSGIVKPNLEHARETIDILGILHEKTTGNLTPSETRFFDNVLYELKLAYVEIIKRGKAD